MKVVVKKSGSGGSSTHEVEITNTEMSVRDFKEQISGTVGLPWERIRLVWGGRVYEDNYPLSHYNVAEGTNMHCLEYNAPLNSNSVPSQMQVPTAGGGRGNPMLGGMNEEEVAAMMNNPMMDWLFQNPEMLQMMMRMNPQMNELMENNPEMARILSDPETLQQSLNAMRNPGLMQEMMRNADRGMANLNTIPGGEAALRQVHSEMMDPLYDWMAGGNGTAGGSGGVNYEQDTSGWVPNAPMPNPFAANRNSGGGAPGGASGATGGAGGAGAPGMPGANPFWWMMGGAGAPGGAGGAAGQPNPFMQMMMGMPPPGGAGGAPGAWGAPGAGGPNPFLQMMQGMQAGGGLPGAGAPGGAGGAAPNPFAWMFGAPPAAAADTNRDPTDEEFKLEFQYLSQPAVKHIFKRSSTVEALKAELEPLVRIRKEYIRLVRWGTVWEDSKWVTEYVKWEDIPAEGLLKIFVLKNIPTGTVEQPYLPPNPLAALLGGGPGWAGGLGGQNPLAALLGGGPMGGMGALPPGFAAFDPALAGVAAAPAVPGVPPEQRYATQLEQLAGMGFSDRDQCIRVLDQVGGDFNLALDRLFGM